MVNNFAEFDFTANSQNFRSFELFVHIFLRKSEILNGQSRFICPAFTYRICFGKQMATLSVTVDKVDYFEFFLNFFRNTFYNYRVVGQLFNGMTIEALTGKIKALKKGAPGWFNRIGIFLVFFIEIIYEFSVNSVQERKSIHVLLFQI